jgi:hypothetical protein
MEPPTSTEIAICWSSTSIIEGQTLLEQRHHRLGNKIPLLLTAKTFKPTLFNQDTDNLSTLIQGSAMKQRSGLFSKIKFLRANIEGELAKPLTFQ